MSDTGSLYLLKALDSFPVPRAKDWLGRIVANFADPRDKYTPSLEYQIKLEKNVDYDEDGGFHNVGQVMNHVSSRAGKAEICKIFGLDSSSATSYQCNIETPRVWHLKLHNAEKILNERVLNSHKSTRPGMTNSITFTNTGQEVKDYRKAWMIVGFLLCDYAAYDMTTSQDRDIGGHIDPVQLVGSVVSPGTATVISEAVPGLSVDIGARNKFCNSSTTRAIMLDKRIFAIEYRRVEITLKWQFWRRAEARLGKKLKGPCLFGGSDSDSDSNSAPDRDSNSDGIFGRSASDREVSVWLDPVSFDEIDEDGLEALVTVVDND